MEAEITLTVTFGPRVTPKNIEQFIKETVDWVNGSPHIEEAKLVEHIINTEE